VKEFFCTLCAIFVITLGVGALSSVQAQTPSATPDPFAVQLTSSPNSSFASFAGDITANGRFVVLESNGNIATQNSASRNNADGNREIFLFDYAQRRIFQITNTRNVPRPETSPSPTPNPSPTPADPSRVQIEISNNRPVISNAPALNAQSKRVYTIIFSSNAPDPGNFDGTDTGGALAADGNQELWVYEIPAVDDINLSSGADVALVDLTAGTFSRITNTPASRVPSPGGTGVLPFVADDNRDATISDDGNILAFVSTRNLVLSVGNTDGNPELFLFNRVTALFTQVTNTLDVVDSQGRFVYSVFNENPSLSAGGSVLAFVSNANLAGNNNDDGNGHGNAEIYVADYNGASVSNLRQVTRTKADASNATVNIFSLGRRLSRDGSVLAFESLADDPKANGSNKPFLAIFVYNLSSDTFTQVAPRALSSPGDIIHFPTFTDYNGALSPSTLVFASALNFRADGTFPTQAQDSEGLNPSRVTQVFATQIPATSSNTFTRLTKNPQGQSFGGIRPLASDSRRRIAFSLGGIELGGGNPDFSTEVFYLLSPPVTTESAEGLSFFTGASNIPVPAPSPVTVLGLAPGELSIVRAAVALAPSNQSSTDGSETMRTPALPVELNGVSLSVNGGAAGLYFVGSSPKQINFVMPVGLSASSTPATVIINNSGTALRGSLLIVASQPDIFTTTNDADGRAIVTNVTNPMIRSGEPFSVMSLDKDGNLVPTVLEISLTGVRNATTSQVKVTVATTDITGGDSILFVGPNKEMLGFDLINFKLPASLAGAGDVPIIVTITSGSSTFMSRPASTAPHISIN
jgi:uncharacterized protein (TIGR03437 family)